MNSWKCSDLCDTVLFNLEKVAVTELDSYECAEDSMYMINVFYLPYDPQKFVCLSYNNEEMRDLDYRGLVGTMEGEMQ